MMRQLSGFFLIGLLSLSGLGCSQPPENPATLHKIIGDNSLLPVSITADNLPEELRNAADAVGFLSMRCTGTHVGDGMVLTAGHCLAAWMSELPEPQILKGIPCGENTAIPISIAWGYRLDQNEEPTVKSESDCEKILYAEHNEIHDIALLKFKNPPQNFVPLDLSQMNFLQNGVTILSHPSSRPLEWSSESCVITSGEKLDLDPKSRFTHDCDTEGGSSGAALIDRKSLKVIGVHNGGRFDGDGAPWNFGTYLQVLKDHVKFGSEVAGTGFSSSNL